MTSYQAVALDKTKPPTHTYITPQRFLRKRFQTGHYYLPADFSPPGEVLTWRLYSLSGCKLATSCDVRQDFTHDIKRVVMRVMVAAARGLVAFYSPAHCARRHLGVV